MIEINWSVMLKFEWFWYNMEKESRNSVKWAFILVSRAREILHPLKKCCQIWENIIPDKETAFLSVDCPALFLLGTPTGVQKSKWLLLHYSICWHSTFVISLERVSKPVLIRETCPRKAYLLPISPYRASHNTIAIKSESTWPYKWAM